MFLHFELVPDRLPDGLRALLAQFAPGAVQLEVGIQSFDPEVAKRISRRQDVPRLEDNLRFLRASTGVHVHADLIVGLPGEDLETFGRGFDRLVALDPHEIQVGILKRLRGTPIIRHDAEWRMVYAQHAPYEILQTRVVTFADMQRMRRFARFWDLVKNSGRFTATTPLLWHKSSPFIAFLAFADWLWATTHATHGIALARLAELLVRYLVEERGCSDEEVMPRIEADMGRDKLPPSLLARAPAAPFDPRAAAAPRRLPKRQARHQGETHVREGTHS